MSAPTSARPAPPQRRSDLVAAWWARLAGWQQALVVYALTRAVGFVVLERTSRFQAANVWSEADPGYLGMATLWDATWYERIVLEGYPDEVPRDASGRAGQNAWAFYPLYPLAVRALVGVTGLPFEVVAPTLSLLLGAAAAVVLHALLREVAGARVALGGVLLVCCYPAAPVLQIAYTESLALLLLCAALLLLVRRRYLAAVPVVLLLALARPVVLPFAGVVGLHLLRRLAARGRDPFPPGEAARVVALGAASFAGGWLWPAVVWARTGEATAYTDTMAAWRSAGVVRPLVPWLDASRYVLGPLVGPVLVAAALAAFAVLVLRTRAGRAVGPDLQAWCLVYVAYLVVVLDPYTSTIRYLLLLVPVAGMLAAASRSRAYLLALAGSGLALQVVWVVWLLRFEPPSDWPP